MSRIHVSELPRKADGTLDLGIKPGMVSRPPANRYVLRDDHVPDAGKKVRAHPRQDESRLQQAMVQAVRLKYAEAIRQSRLLLYAVPNGGQRNAATGARLKAEGVLAGVPDLVLHVGGLTVYLEVKTPGGRMQDSQDDFAAYCQANAIPHHVVRSVDDMLTVVHTHFTTVYSPF